jgi:hypothetical protein
MIWVFFSNLIQTSSELSKSPKRMSIIVDKEGGGCSFIIPPPIWHNHLVMWESVGLAPTLAPTLSSNCCSDRAGATTLLLRPRPYFEAALEHAPLSFIKKKKNHWVVATSTVQKGVLYPHFAKRPTKYVKEGMPSQPLICVYYVYNNGIWSCYKCCG